MAVTYTWKISNCNYDVATGGITHIHWRCTATENDIAVTTLGVTKHTPNSDSSDYIQYSDVSENTALGWVWSQVDKDEPEAQLVARVAEKKTPTKAQGVPW